MLKTRSTIDCAITNTPVVKRAVIVIELDQTLLLWTAARRAVAKKEQNIAKIPVVLLGCQ
jgi:hypothetical protein